MIELPTQKTASNGPPPSSSQTRTLASTRAPCFAASARVRATIASLASEAVTSKPRSASPTASVPVPHAQSSTRAPGDSSPRTISNAAALPSGASSDSGTSQS